MHDRRIDGKPEVFGNAGGLYMSAMTWYDHSTRSIWSQPLGKAIEGERFGTELRLLPSQLTTWGAWRAEHPDSLVMVNDVARVRGRSRVRFDDDVVIGLVLEGQAKAFRYPAVRDAGVVNDWLGAYPVLVWADEDNFHAYLRQVDDRALTFRWEEAALVDEETGSKWDVARGAAFEGPLQGAVLQAVPSLSSYDWAWADFYPESEIWEGE